MCQNITIAVMEKENQMSKLIDADKLKEELRISQNEYGVVALMIESICSTIDKQPEAVVRCKDCKYATMTINGECKYCEQYADEDGYCEKLYFSGDYYCGSGERKTDG